MRLLRVLATVVVWVALAAAWGLVVAPLPLPEYPWIVVAIVDAAGSSVIPIIVGAILARFTGIWGAIAGAAVGALPTAFAVSEGAFGVGLRVAVLVALALVAMNLYTQVVYGRWLLVDRETSREASVRPAPPA